MKEKEELNEILILKDLLIKYCKDEKFRDMIRYVRKQAKKEEAEKWHAQIRKLQKYETERVKKAKIEQIDDIIKEIREYELPDFRENQIFDKILEKMKKKHLRK